MLFPTSEGDKMLSQNPPQEGKEKKKTVNDARNRGKRKKESLTQNMFAGDAEGEKRKKNAFSTE